MSKGPSPFELSVSRGFGEWLAEQKITLVFTTYQAGKVFFIGSQDDGRLAIHERSIARCMGLHVDGDALWLASRYQLWRFQNALEDGQRHSGYDRLYVPQVGYTTGYVDTHDVAIDADGQPLFVATAFNCVATTTTTHSLRPVWRPPWISKIVAEDRCHLNGMALANGRLAYATAVSQSDVIDAWRDRRRDGGVLIDTDADEVICGGLSMPHSPRVQVRDGKRRVWLLEAGRGQLGCVDPGQGFEAVSFCPGFARGLHLYDRFAVVGLSAARENRTFDDLEFGERLTELDTDARCGLHVVDLETGNTIHWVRIEGVVRELYDVAVLPGVRRAMAIGFKGDEIERVITLDSN